MPPGPDPTIPAGATLSRRNFVRGAAAVAGGLIIGIEFSPLRALADEPVPTGARFNAFIHVAPDDTVTFTLPAVEMGQGVYTSQTQCLAEELDIALEKVVAAHAPADQANYGSPVFIVQATGGSTTTLAWSGPLRKAGATARALLVQAAAQQWGVDAGGLTTENGVITDKASGRTLRYGEVADRAAALPLPANVKLKDPSQFRLIGKPVHRIDTAAKATGKTIYGIDVMRPGMKFATLRISPVFGGKVAHVGQADGARNSRRAPGGGARRSRRRGCRQHLARHAGPGGARYRMGARRQCHHGPGAALGRDRESLGGSGRCRDQGRRRTRQSSTTVRCSRPHTSCPSSPMRRWR